MLMVLRMCGGKTSPDEGEAVAPTYSWSRRALRSRRLSVDELLWVIYSRSSPSALSKAPSGSSWGCPWRAS